MAGAKGQDAAFSVGHCGGVEALWGCTGVGGPPGEILGEAFSCWGLSWGVSQEGKVGHEGRRAGNAAKIHRVWESWASLWGCFPSLVVTGRSMEHQHVHCHPPPSRLVSVILSGFYGI